MLARIRCDMLSWCREDENRYHKKMVFARIEVLSVNSIARWTLFFSPQQGIGEQQQIRDLVLGNVCFLPNGSVMGKERTILFFITGPTDGWWIGVFCDSLHNPTYIYQPQLSQRLFHLGRCDAFINLSTQGAFMFVRLPANG